MLASIEQIWNIVASRPKFVFSPTFIVCSPICSNNCGVFFLRKYILVFEKWLFSFDRSNMQVFTMNIQCCFSLKKNKIKRKRKKIAITKMRSVFWGRRLRGLFPIVSRRKLCENKDRGITMQILKATVSQKVENFKRTHGVRPKTPQNLSEFLQSTFTFQDNVKMDVFVF